MAIAQRGSSLDQPVRHLRRLWCFDRAPDLDLLLASLPAGAATARRPRGQGQAQLKPGTSRTRRIGELQLTAVRGGQPPGDVEPKPEPTAVAGRRRVQAHMTLEDPIAIG